MSRYFVTTFSGAGAPSSGLGNNENTYTNTTSGDVYYKHDGAWVNLNATTWELSSGETAITYPKNFAYTATKIYCQATRYVYVSGDSGVTWTQVLFNSTGNPSIFSICTIDERVLIGTQNLIQEIRYSDNYGSNWTTVDVNASAILGYIVGICSDGTYLYLVADSSTDLSYVSDANLTYRSSDNGATWSVYGTGLTTSDTPTGMWRANGILFLATNLGLYKLIGTTWTAVTVENSVVPENIIYHGTAYYGTVTDGVYKSVDAGLNWSYLSSPTTGQGYNVRSLLSIGSTLLAGLYAGGLWKSTDNGATWTDDTANMPSPFPPDTAYVYCLVNPFSTTAFAGLYASDAIYTKTY